MSDWGFCRTAMKEKHEYVDWESVTSFYRNLPSHDTSVDNSRFLTTMLFQKR